MVPDFSKWDDYVDMPEDEFDKIGEYIPGEVCHYTKMSTALTKILPNKQIRLGSLHETNDPLETQDRIHEWINNPGNPWEPVGRIINLMQLIQIEKLNIKVFSTCCHHNPFWNGTFKQSKLYKYGFSRFSMWAHYSKRHKGVCIIFDGNALNNHIKHEVGDEDRVRHGFVKYNYEESLRPIQGENIDEIWDNYKPNFLCKSPDWKPEHEFRWLARIDRKDLLVPIENAIKAVIVGQDFDMECLPLLKKLCKELSISPWQIKWGHGVLSTVKL